MKNNKSGLSFILILISISIYSYCFAQKPLNKVSFIAQDSSFYINRLDSGHLGFPDIIKLRDKTLIVIYRQGKKHVDPSGHIVMQYGSPDGKTWSKPETFFDNPLLDERDMSLTMLSNGNIAFNYFGSIAPADTSKPWQIFTYFGLSKNNGKRVDPSTLVQIDKNNISNLKFSSNASGYWTDEKNNVISYEGVSSPVIEYNKKLILCAYGGVPMVKKANDKNQTHSRISLFTSDDNGRKWDKMVINPEDCSSINLQEPCLLDVDGKRMLMHIRTQVEKKYSLKDKMMQSVSDDGGKTWSAWKAFGFVGHAPYLYKLSNDVIISAYRDFDPPSGLEGAALIYSLDKGNTWSKPIVFDTPRKDNDSSYPSIQELDNNKFIIVYYTDNGKAIKGRIFKFVNE